MSQHNFVHLKLINIAHQLYFHKNYNKKGVIPAHFLGDFRHACRVHWSEHWVLPLSLVLCFKLVDEPFWISVPSFGKMWYDPEFLQSCGYENNSNGFEISW